MARLKVKRAQADYVASNIESILEAFATREAGGIAAPFALYDGVALVGFVMIGYGDLPGEENPAISAGNYCLWRLMIDERWQGRGYGKQAIEKAVEYVRTKPFGEAEYCWLSYDPDNPSGSESCSCRSALRRRARWMAKRPSRRSSCERGTDDENLASCWRWRSC